MFNVRPLVVSEDQPTRLSIFVQFTSDALGLSQSVICDMYADVNLALNPDAIESQFVLTVTDYPLFEEDLTAHSGVKVVDSINELSWDPDW